MSWVNDLGSVLGIPAGAVTLAAAMYAGCAAAEKAARPEALRDIARILKDPSWSRSVRPSAIIGRLFNWTFGDRHLSWRCVRRSVVATLLLSISLGLIYHTIFGIEFMPVELVSATSHLIPIWTTLCTTFLLFAVIPDYVALLKTRLLVTAIVGASSIVNVFLLVITDILFSTIISFSFTVCLYLLLDVVRWIGGNVTEWMWVDLHFVMFGTEQIGALYLRMASGVTHGQDVVLGVLRSMTGPFLGERSGLSFAPIFLASTLFTSVWTILILLSTTVLKLLAPLHRFTAWFFDVEKHPVQAIGIVAGALVMIGSLIWTVLRAVI